MLLFSDIPCYHDQPHRLPELVKAGKPFGMSSPSMFVMAAKYVAQVYSDAPIVVVDRPLDESFDALDRFIGWPTPTDARLRYESSFQALLDRLPAQKMLRIKYSGLELFETVDRVYRHCLGQPLSRERYDAFQLLRVEQHLPKVIANTPRSLFRR